MNESSILEGVDFFKNVLITWLHKASLVAQLVQNLPEMGETWVGKIPWRRERLPTLVFGLENTMDCIVHGVAKSWTRLCHMRVTFTSHQILVAVLRVFITHVGSFVAAHGLASCGVGAW